MASGLSDSANVLYFTDSNYNPSNVAIDSYKRVDFDSNFINSGNNYQLSINKLKLSSLASVRLGNVPYQTWKFGMTMVDNQNNRYYSNAWVALPNEVGIVDYIEKYILVSSNATIQVYSGNANTNITTQEVEFIPRNEIGDQIYPQYGFYDYKNNLIWVCDFTGVYIYNLQGTFQNSYQLTNIVNATFNDEICVLVVCDSVYSIDHDIGVFTVNLFTVDNNIIQTPRTITQNLATNALSYLACAYTDGVIVIAGYNRSNITTFDFETLEPIVDTIIQSATNIKQILCNSNDDIFVYLDDEYTPTLTLGKYIVENTNPYTSIEFVDFLTDRTILPYTDNITSFSMAYGGYGFISAATLLGLANETYSNINNISQFSYPYSGQLPSTSTTYNVDDTNAILIGVAYNNAGYNITASWTLNEFINQPTLQIPLSLYIDPGSTAALPQIAGDPHTGNIYVCFGSTNSNANNHLILGTNQAPTSQLTTQPYLSFSGEWISITSNIPVEHLTFDTQYPNTIYAVANGIVYIGYMVGNNRMVFRQYFRSLGVSYQNFITMPTLLQTGITQTKTINKNFLPDFTNITSITSNTVNYTCIQQSIKKDLLFIGNLSNNMVQIYNLSTFVFNNNVIGFQLQTPFFGGNTTYDSYIPVGSDSVYNMDQYVQAFNTALASCYQQLKNDMGSSIPIQEPPYLTLDYQTKYCTLWFDPNFSKIDNGIFCNPALYKYLLFPASIYTSQYGNDSLVNGFYKYRLNTVGSITQNQQSFYKLNQLDKLLVLTNVSINGDYSGKDNKTSIMTDLEIDTQNEFFDGSGSLIYNAVLLRKYDIITSGSIHYVTYQFKIKYKDGIIETYMIPPQELASIKLQFDRIY